jgi:Protein of unknown function (DUF998)
MTQHTAPATTKRSTPASCDPAARVTKSLLAYGVIAGPTYVLVSLTQALTRDGFEFTRHPWSALANGPLGWIQVANFVLSGLMTVAFAAGLRRALRPGRAATWGPRLIGVYGASLVAAGAFRADPAMGFPPGTAETAGEVSWHGMLHFAAGGIGFPCLIAACFVIARRFAVERRSGWGTFSSITGVVFLAGFVGLVMGGGSAVTLLTFTAAVGLACAWTCAVAVHLYGRTARGSTNR